MNWEVVLNIVTIIISFVALGFAIATIRINRRTRELIKRRQHYGQ